MRSSKLWIGPSSIDLQRGTHWPTESFFFSTTLYLFVFRSHQRLYSTRKHLPYRRRGIKHYGPPLSLNIMIPLGGKLLL